MESASTSKPDKPATPGTPEPIVIRKLDKIETTGPSSNPSG